MIATVLAFFGTKLGKYVGIVLGILALVGALWGAKNLYDNSIRKDEQAKIEAARLEQVIKDNEELRKRTEKIEVENSRILAETQAQNNKVVERYEKVQTYIQSPEAQASNRQTSDVIKNTIRMLNDEE
jgi:CHASE3 domain sensor protein